MSAEETVDNTPVKALDESMESPSPFIREHSVFFNSAAKRQAEALRNQMGRDSNESEELVSFSVKPAEQQSGQEPAADDMMIVSSPTMVASLGLIHGHRIPAEASAASAAEQTLQRQLWDANHTVIRLKAHIENLRLSHEQDRAALESRIRSLEGSKQTLMDQYDLLQQAEETLRVEKARWEYERGRLTKELSDARTIDLASRLETRIVELEGELSQARSAARDVQLESDAQISRLEAENRILSEQIESFRAVLSERQAEESGQSTPTMQSPEDTLAVNAALLKSASQVPVLESKIRSLERDLDVSRKTAETALVLREELASAQSRLQSLEPLQRHCAELQARLDHLTLQMTSAGTTPKRKRSSEELVRDALQDERIVELRAELHAKDALIAALRANKK